MIFDGVIMILLMSQGCEVTFHSAIVGEGTLRYKTINHLAKSNLDETQNVPVIDKKGLFNKNEAV